MKVHESVNLVQHEEVRNTSNISNIITHLIISIYTQIKHSTSIEYNVVDQPIPAYYIIDQLGTARSYKESQAFDFEAHNLHTRGAFRHR